MDKDVVFATILERKDRKAAISKIKMRPSLAALLSDLYFSGMAISGR